MTSPGWTGFVLAVLLTFVAVACTVAVMAPGLLPWAVVLAARLAPVALLLRRAALTVPLPDDRRRGRPEIVGTSLGSEGL